MAYYLDSLTPASTRYATIPSVTFSGDFEIKVIAAQLGTSPTFIFAGSGVAGQNGIDLYRNTSGNYQLFINASSAIGTTTPVTNSITAPDTVIVRRLSGVVDLIINGVSRGTFSTSATLSVERLFHRNGWANYGRMGLYEFTIVGGGSYNTSWNASNSPSGGSAWTSSGGQVMTQAGSWPADNSEWVFYSSGATAYTDTLLAGSYAHSGSLLNSSVGYSSSLQAGSFAHSGSQLSSSVARSSVLLAGSYTHSGSALGSAVGYSSTLQGGAFSYSGSELQSIISNGAQNYSDTLLGGSFTHSGSDLQSAIARNSTLLAGSYSHAGSDLSASLAFYSTLNGGTYSHFGSMLQSTISGQVTVSIEGYTITFAADDVSGAFAADMVGGSYQSDYIEAIKWLI